MGKAMLRQGIGTGTWTETASLGKTGFSITESDRLFGIIDNR
jgi:hypothetical protein